MSEGTIADVLEGRATWCVSFGDHRDPEALLSLPESCIHAVCCDPPYELGFMGRAWDRSGIAYSVDMWRAVLRGMKPGAHLVAFGGTRTHHRVACAIEDAGFEVRDCLQWLFGSGFPKSLDVSKAIDDAAGAERVVIGTKAGLPGYVLTPGPADGIYGGRIGGSGDPVRECAITAPATPEAEQWNGWGTALKPAYEPIILARKPLTGTVSGNVLEHGTGALHIDGCRVPTDWNEADRPDSWKRSGHTADEDASKIAAPPGNGIECHPGGRWPPNVLLTHDARCGDECVNGCPVRILDEQSGESPTGSVAPYSEQHHYASSYQLFREKTYVKPADSGTASRFFPRFRYCAKASTAEREAGCSHLHAAQRDDGREPDAPGANNPRNRGGQLRRNTCPTVKPVDLMRWLVRLVTPPGGVVLDHFLGSGSTGLAALMEGFRFIGFDFTPEHLAIARARLEHVARNPGRPLGGEPRREADSRQASLFGGDHA